MATFACPTRKLIDVHRSLCEREYLQPKINIALEKGDPRSLIILSSVFKRGSSLWQSQKQWNTVSGSPQNLQRGESVRLHLNRKILVGITE